MKKKVFLLEHNSNKKLLSSKNQQFPMFFGRGGVEDTRLETKAKDTGASVLQKKKVFKIFFRRSQKKRSSKIFFGRKRSSNIFFKRSLLEETKKRSLQIFREVFRVFQRNFYGSKIVMSSNRGQGNFRGLEA